MAWNDGTIVQNSIAKDDAILAAELFVNYMASSNPNGGTIENEKDLALTETPIKNAFESLGIKFGTGKMISQQNSTEVTYAMDRSLDDVSGAVLASVKTNTVKLEENAIDAKERFITAKKTGLYSKVSQEIYETVTRQDAMGRHIKELNVNLYVENLIKHKIKHDALHQEYLEMTLLQCFSDPYKEKTINGNTINDVSNKMFDASFFANLSGAPITKELLAELPTKFYLNNQVRLNTETHIVILTDYYTGKRIIDTYRTLPEYTNVVLSKEVTNEMLRNIKNSNGISPNIQNKFLLEAEASRTSIRFGNITIVMVRNDLAYQLYNETTGNFECRIFTAEAFSLIDEIKPEPILAQERMPNPNRQVAKLGNSMAWMVRELKDATVGNTMIDAVQYYSISQFVPLPNKFNKGGSIAFDNGDIYGDATSKAAIVANYRSLYENKIAKFGLTI